MTLVHLLFVVVFKKRAVPRYFTIVLYLSSSIAIGVGRLFIIMASGFNSNTYVYFYFYSDAVLTICLYFMVMSLYAQVF